VVMSKGNIISYDDLPPTVASGSDNDYIKIEVGSSMEDAEREMIRATLRRENGNKSRTADVLGLGPKTLHLIIQEYKLEE